jgi:outer membrane cobalamin receptor
MSSNYYAEQLFDDTWGSIPPSNIYDYYQDVNALYVQAGNKTGKFSYQLGLRYEDTDFYANMEESNRETSLKYSNWFPSAFFTYELSSTTSFQLSYSKRLRRPRFWDLNPFWGLSDGRFNWEGNPFLEPELTDSYELGFLKEFKSGNIYVGTYYRYTTDEIERIFDVNDVGYSVFKPVNLGFTNAYGIEMNGSIDFSKWLRTTGSFNFFNSETDGNYKNQNFYSKSYSWRTRLSNNIKMFDNKLEGQITFDYRGPSESPQGKNLSSYGIDLSLSKDIFKDKRGTLSFTVRDLTKSRLRRYERGGKQGDNFYTVGEFAWRRTQEFRLSLQYRINQNKRRGGGRNFDSSEFEGGGAIFGN